MSPYFHGPPTFPTSLFALATQQPSQAGPHTDACTSPILLPHPVDASSWSGDQHLRTSSAPRAHGRRGTSGQRRTDGRRCCNCCRGAAPPLPPGPSPATTGGPFSYWLRDSLQANQVGWGPGGIMEFKAGAPGGNAGLGLRQSLILRSLSGGGRGGWRAHRGCREEGRWESWEAWDDEGCGRWGDKGTGVKVNVAQACPALVTP